MVGSVAAQRRIVFTDTDSMSATSAMSSSSAGARTTSARPEHRHGGIGSSPASYRLHRYRHYVSYFRDVEQQRRCAHYLGAAHYLGLGVHDLRCAASLTACVVE